ncbi:hypothetical protein [Uliginosibacterium aquaticum]|uniref:Uncharacterized protein n=1 Tax=Uliginosibacterium aquaticum TaxID=2731212 RepID=A0ABX2IFX2_9RHOO|nr:hypothetical protein [Uliginosibacterium aquaticum]NSL55367.1 hypothetical protein [Uliginosibacterium aquaticum]
MNHDNAHAQHTEALASSEIELERQAYLEELQIDSLQFGVGRALVPATQA